MSTNQKSLGYGRDIFREDHEAFRGTVRNFFQREIEPYVRQWEDDGFYPAELFRKAGKLGLLCVGIPEEYGGGGGDMLHHMILHEEHGYSPAGASLEAGLQTDSSAYVILDAGTEEQKHNWLPKMAAGEEIMELALSEPSAGSDAKGIKTRAKRDGSDYVINGSKMWVSNGPVLTQLLVVAKCKSDDGEDDLAIFIVPAGARGVTISRKTELLLRGCGGVSEAFFDDVRIPAANVLGGTTRGGLGAAMSTITVGRMAAASRFLAASELALSLTVDYTKERSAFQKRIYDFQLTQSKLATMKTEIAAGRAFVDSCLARAASGTLSNDESAMAKLFVSEVEGRVMDESLQLHGAMGFSDENPISKMYAFARVHRIFLGTSEILRLSIARGM
ncbi:acyl-CoA dehydrogenase family protein [Gordonia terrae]